MTLSLIKFVSIGSMLAFTEVSADIFINEIRIDDPATSTDAGEYFELYNDGPVPISLDGYFYLVIGDTPSGGSGVIESITDLTGRSIPAGGYFVGAENSRVDFDLSGDGTRVNSLTVDPVTGISFENSDNVTHLLVTNSTASRNQDLDTDDDGTLDITPWDTVLDIIALQEDDAGDLFYPSIGGFMGTTIGPTGIFAPAHVFRSPDGGQLVIGPFGTSAIRGAESPEMVAGLVSGSADEPLFDSPGTANPLLTTGGLALTFSSDSLLESSTATILATITRSSSDGVVITDGDLPLTLGTNDPSEAIVPGSVTIPDGSSAITFPITPVDDSFIDGSLPVIISAQGVGFDTAEGIISIDDDDSDTSELIFNEVFSNVSLTTGDSNGDGLISDSIASSDHFVEIVNVSPNTLDLTDYEITTNNENTHIFRDGTLLGPNCALVVFGGSGATVGHTAAFGEAEIQISSEGPLFLQPRSQLSILDPSGSEIASVTLPASTDAAAGSITRAIDGDPLSAFLQHAPANAGSLFSPGTFQNGSSFCDLEEMLVLTPSATSVPEGAGDSDFSLTLTSPTPAASTVRIAFGSSDPDILSADSFPDELESGTTSTEVNLLVRLENEIPDGDAEVTLTAVASGYLNPTPIVVTVIDNDILTFTTDVVINEFDSRQVGTDTEEFIELFNTNSAEQSLSNLYIVLVNGSNDRPYRIIDLTGNSIAPNGYFVIGSNAIPPSNIPFGSSNTSNLLQNGPDAIFLFAGNATAVTAATELAALTDTLLDAVVYTTAENTDEALLAFAGPGQNILNEDATGSNETTSLSRIPDGGPPLSSNSFTNSRPTPGAPNEAAPATNDFASWAAANGIPGAADTDDGDNDGIPARLEYALGFDPTSFNVLPHPRPTATEQLAITYPKGPDAATNPSVDYLIQTSPDLVTFTTLTPDRNNGTEISALLTPSHSAPQLFVRIFIP